MVSRILLRWPMENTGQGLVLGQGWLSLSLPRASRQLETWAQGRLSTEVLSHGRNSSKHDRLTLLRSHIVRQP